MIGIKHTAEPEHLFQTDYEELMKLSKGMSDLFPKITAHSLWVGKRGRSDPHQLGSSFLITRVRDKPDQYNFKKPKNKMVYFQDTAFLLVLIRRADGKVTSLYINRAHTVVHGESVYHATM